MTIAHGAGLHFALFPANTRSHGENHFNGHGDCDHTRCLIITRYFSKQIVRWLTPVAVNNAQDFVHHGKLFRFQKQIGKNYGSVTAVHEFDLDYHIDVNSCASWARQGCGKIHHLADVAGAGKHSKRVRWKLVGKVHECG